MPATVNITVNNDADFYRVFQYVVATTSDPIDITGARMWMMLRRHARDSVAVMRLGTDTGEIVITDAVNGKWTIFIPQEELERLGTGEFDHSLIMDWHGLKDDLWTGKFTNNPGASR